MIKNRRAHALALEAFHSIELPVRITMIFGGLCYD